MTQRYENAHYDPGPAIKDEEVQSTRTLAVSILQVFRAIGIPPAEETSLAHRILRLCNEVERLDRATWQVADERDKEATAKLEAIAKLEAVQADSNRALESHRESLDRQHTEHLSDLRRLGGQMQAAIDEHARQHAESVDVLGRRIIDLDKQVSDGFEDRNHKIRVLRNALREALDMINADTILNSDDVVRLERVATIGMDQVAS